MNTQKKIKQKRWHERRSKKIQKKWYGKNKRIRSYATENNLKVSIKYNSEHQVVAETPENFSFLQNPEETIEYFDDLISIIQQKKFGQKFYLNSINIKNVTADALIYMIAIVYNIKMNKALKYEFTGNVPVNKAARKVFENSGYLNYFKTNSLVMPKGNEYVRIICGKNVDNNVAQIICDFAIERLGITRLDTKVLYATLIELMSNTAKHAYQQEKTMMVPCWYLYAMCADNRVLIAFIDIGEGIPNTIKKKWTEKINPFIKDADLLKVAFTESGRSETGLEYRGRGLPDLLNHVRLKNLRDFFVMSGHGSCTYDLNDDKLMLKEYERSTHGTIYSFCLYGGYANNVEIEYSK